MVARTGTDRRRPGRRRHGFHPRRVSLKGTEPTWNIILLERLDKVAPGILHPGTGQFTGHSALCELNYAPAGPDGTVSAAKGAEH